MSLLRCSKQVSLTMFNYRQIYAPILDEVYEVGSIALLEDLLLVCKISGRSASVDQYEKAVSI
jgi:hypothetical protein